MMDEMMSKMVDRTMTKIACPLKKLILEQETSLLGDCVLKGIQVSTEQANVATAICRRRFKEDDIVLMVVLDSNEEGEAGIVFTEKGIYH